MTKVVLGSALLFVLFGLILIPSAGIEYDEGFFTYVFYGPPHPSFSITIFHHVIPLMIGTYAGALKAWLYWPILHVFGPNPYSFRVPVVLAGAAAIVLFFRLAQHLAGSRAALLACLLLATDPSFLLTNTYDWGPVAMEHVLLMSGCLLIFSRRPVFGFFVFGLALWNKAVFAWALSGLAAGVAVAYLPELRRFLADRRLVARCACAFIVGALPLIIYNVHSPNATLRTNVQPSVENFHAKLVSLRITLDGSALFGVVVEPDWADKPKTPRSIDGRIALWIRKRLGPHDSSLFVYALIFSLLSAPLWWQSAGRRAALFAIAFSVVAFFAMAVTRYTGAAHHIVLLWPMPHLLAGIAVAALRPRWLMAGIATVLVTANLLVINQYLVELDRNGAGRLFTDASYALSESFSDSAGDTIYVVDWNIETSLNFLHRGLLKLVPEWPTMMDSSIEAQRREVERILQDPRGIFVARVPGLQQYPDAGNRVVALAHSAGYEKRVLRTIEDSNGRPVFEVYRFVVPRGTR